MKIDCLDMTHWIPALRRACDVCTLTTNDPSGALCLGIAGTVHATLRLRSAYETGSGALPIGGDQRPPA